MILSFEIQGDNTLQKITFKTGVQDVARMFVRNPGFAFPGLNGKQLELVNGQGTVREAVDHAFTRNKLCSKIVVRACSQHQQSVHELLDLDHHSVATPQLLV
jgi:S-adenosylhomocysteine hydrolase